MKLMDIQIELIQGVVVGVEYAEEVLLPSDAYLLVDIFFIRIMFEFYKG